ncbi:superoxide dismutase, partial [Acinetobacter baumannii]
MKRRIAQLALLACASAASAAMAAEAPLKVALNLVNAQGVASPAGEVTISETPYGLLFQPALSGLPAGVHGFHVHQ